MDYSTYTGVTACMKATLKNESRLRLLAEAIPALRPHVDMRQIIPMNYTTLWMSDKFTELYEFGHLVRTPGSHDHQFPIDTPSALQSVRLQFVQMKPEPMISLYLPMLSYSKHDIDTAVDDVLSQLLPELFGSDLVSVSARSIDESGRFDEATERLVIGNTTCTA